ncbi:MAG: protein phosphatase 2C family protein, partial [Tabrizicola sp.]|nr:protein phosphatase 2C family protein [Tabrizicola sp.]
VKPYELKQGDIVVCASDGLQFLSNAQIEKVLSKYRKTRSTEIAERLLEELGRLDDPDQDNISFTIIKVNDASARQKEDTPNRPSVAVERPKGLTTVVAEQELLPVLADVAGAGAGEGTVVPLPPLAPEAEPVAAELSEAVLETVGETTSVVPRRFAALG